MDDILFRIASFTGVSENTQHQKLLSTLSTSVVNKVGANGTDLVGHQKKRFTAVSTKIGLLCFSKDRPFQLEQLLISSKHFLKARKDDITIIVLYSPGNDNLVRLDLSGASSSADYFVVVFCLPSHLPVFLQGN
jgi:hypothetical protein